MRRPSAARGSSRPSSPWRARGRRSGGPVRLNEVVEDALDLAGYGLRTAGCRDRPRARARPAAGLGRQRPAAPGAHQPDRQRAAGAAADAAPPRRLRVRAEARDGELRSRSRTTAPACRRGAEAHLRAVLHHQAARRRHGRRPVGLPGHRRRARGPDHGRSEPGRGTRFVVTLPLRRDVPGDGRAGAGRQPRPPAAACWSSTTSRRSRELVAEHLRRDGFTVEVVSSGRMALARLETAASIWWSATCACPTWTGRRCCRRCGSGIPSSPRRWC